MTTFLNRSETSLRFETTKFMAEFEKPNQRHEKLS